MALEFELTKRYRDFCLTVPGLRVADESLVLYGPSGSGKSLTLQCLAGIVRPDAGRIAIDGDLLDDPATGRHLPPHRRRIGYVPQHYGLFPHLSVADNVAFGLDARDAHERRRAVAELLDRTGLGGLGNRWPRQLSGGQQQRVALARALATRPRLLLLDEPFAALDPEIRGQLRADLDRLRREIDLPVVLVTHDLADVYGLADRVAVYQAGRVLQVGTRDEIFRRPASADVARLTGTPNLLPGVVRSRQADGLIVACGDADLIADPGGFAPGHSVIAAIRPEVIQIVRDDRPLSGPVDRNLFAGTLIERRPQGYTYRLAFRPDRWIGVDRLIIDLPALAYDRLGLEAGDRRRIAIDPAVIHLIPAGD